MYLYFESSEKNKQKTNNFKQKEQNSIDKIFY